MLYIRLRNETSATKGTVLAFDWDGVDYVVQTEHASLYATVVVRRRLSQRTLVDAV